MAKRKFKNFDRKTMKSIDQALSDLGWTSADRMKMAQQMLDENKISAAQMFASQAVYAARRENNPEGEAKAFAFFMKEYGQLPRSFR